MHRNHYIPYYNNLQFIKWLIEERDRVGDKNPESTAQNISIIISCCTVLEGFIYTITKDFIFYQSHESGISQTHADVVGRIFKKYYEKLDQAQWSSYAELFLLFTDINLKSYKHWNAIDCMFKMRNQLVHGNEFEFFVDEKSNGKVAVESDNKKLKLLLEFLVSQKLAVTIDSGRSLDFINSKVSNYFFRVLREFCIFTYDQLNTDYHKKSSIDMFHFRN